MELQGHFYAAASTMVYAQQQRQAANMHQLEEPPMRPPVGRATDETTPSWATNSITICSSQDESIRGYKTSHPMTSEAVLSSTYWVHRVSTAVRRKWRTYPPTGLTWSLHGICNKGADGRRILTYPDIEEAAAICMQKHACARPSRKSPISKLNHNLSFPMEAWRLLQ